MQNSTVSAYAYTRQKVSRKFVLKLSQNRFKAIQQNGLYAMIAIKSICTTFSLNPPGMPPVHAKVSVYKLKELLKVKTFKDLAILLYKLSDMGLIAWEYVSFDNKVYITDLTLTIEECRASSGLTPMQCEQQKGAIAKGVGFFFVDKSIRNRFLNTGRFSEVDIAVDLWLSTIYRDDTIELSQQCPLVAYTPADGAEPLCVMQRYCDLSRRYQCSISRLHDVLHRLQQHGIIELRSCRNIGTYIFVPMFAALICKVDQQSPDKSVIKDVAHKLRNAARRAFGKVKSACNALFHEIIPPPTDADVPPPELYGGGLH